MGLGSCLFNLIETYSIFPLNSFSYRGSGGVGNTGLGPIPAKFLKTADNFCAQARYFVHVAFVRVASLLQKNTMVSLHFPLKVVPRPDCLKESPQGLLRAVWSLLRASGELPVELPGELPEELPEELPG